MLNLEESDVVAVTSHEPGGQQDTQYFYEFSSWSHRRCHVRMNVRTPVSLPTHSLVESGLSKNHEPRDFGRSSVRLLAPIGFYCEPKQHDSESGGTESKVSSRGRKTTRDGGTAQCVNSVSVHAMRLRSTVVVLSARLYCTRPSMTREASGEE
jgi:hypothetical protein